MKTRIWKITAVILLIISLSVGLTEIFTYVASIGGYIPDPFNQKTYKTFSTFSYSYSYSNELLFCGGIVLLTDAAFLLITSLCIRKKHQ